MPRGNKIGIRHDGTVQKHTPYKIKNIFILFYLNEVHLMEVCIQ